jgi:hypothetical protein
MTSPYAKLCANYIALAQIISRSKTNRKRQKHPALEASSVVTFSLEVIKCADLIDLPIAAF